jgi:hypothetical protein
MWPFIFPQAPADRGEETEKLEEEEEEEEQEEEKLVFSVIHSLTRTPGLALSVCHGF